MRNTATAWCFYRIPRGGCVFPRRADTGLEPACCTVLQLPSIGRGLANRPVVCHDKWPSSSTLPALLAQLAEQLTLNQRVVGSSPTGGIFDSKRLQTSVCVESPCFPRSSPPSTQEHSTLSVRQEETGSDCDRPQTATENATRLLPRDPALAAVNEAWDRLPEALRAGIAAMVKAAAM